MNKYFSILPYLSFLAFLFSGITFAASPLQTDISAGYTYDDNVTRAELDRDIEKDSILNLDASARYKIPFNDKSYFSVKGTLELNKYLDFDKLSNNRIGIHGSYHFRPFNGYTATRYFISATYEQRLYNSDQRNGSATNLQLGLSKRLTDVVTFYAGFIKEKIDADEPIGVFDADNNRIYLEADFKTSQKNTLYTTLSYFKGDIVSTTIPNQDIINAARPFIVRDDAFLELTPDRWAYKLRAKTTALKIGDIYAITSNQAVDASAFYYKADSDYGISYTGLIANLNYLYRF